MIVVFSDLWRVQSLLPPERVVLLADTSSLLKSGIMLSPLVIENLKVTDKVKIGIYNRLQSLVFRDNGYKNSFEGIGKQQGMVNNSLSDGTYYYVLHFNDSKPVTSYMIINR
jgi:hypothetical protein